MTGGGATPFGIGTGNDLDLGDQNTLLGYSAAKSLVGEAQDFNTVVGAKAVQDATAGVGLSMLGAYSEASNS